MLTALYRPVFKFVLRPLLKQYIYTYNAQFKGKKATCGLKYSGIYALLFLIDLKPVVTCPIFYLYYKYIIKLMQIAL